MSESEVAGIGGGAAGGYPALMAHAYQSASDAEAGDFKSIYASAITLALSELPFTPLFENFVSVVEYDGDRVVASYDLTREDLDWDWTPGADTTTGVLTVDTAVFDAASTFVVTMRGPDPEVIDVMTDFGGPYTHQSQRDFDAIWKAVTTLDVGTVSAMAMVPDKDDFRAVAEIGAGGKLRRVYTRISHGFTWAPAGGGDEGVLTIVGADLLAGSTFIVFVAGFELGTDRADAVTDVSTRVKRTQPIDRQGNVITGGGGTSGGLTLYASPYHFTVARNADTQLDLAGSIVALISQPYQFVEIKSYGASGDYVETYKPETHRFSWDAANSRVTVLGATFAAGGVWDVKVLASDRGLDLPSNALMALIQNHYALISDSAGVSFGTIPQDFTLSWVDFGTEIPTFGMNTLKIWLTFLKNTSTGLRAKILDKHEGVGVEEYSPQIETLGASDTKIAPAYWEQTTAANELLTLVYKLDGVTPFVQLQIQAAVLGGTAGQVTAGYYTRGWR